MKFAANLSLLFTELSPERRPKAAAEAGFTGVEVLFPYDMPAQELAQLCAGNALELALINTPEPDWDQGARGSAALPGQHRKFRQEFSQALEYAKISGATHVHIMSGIATGPEALDTFFDNLKWAAQQDPDQSLTIEPINPIDMPGYFLNDFDLASRILAQINAPNLSLQFDAYHAHRITSDVGAAWERHKSRVRHVQVASAEGRHEPDIGTIDYKAFFAKLQAQSYEHWVSAEYIPAQSTADGLEWIKLLHPERS